MRDSALKRFVLLPRRLLHTHVGNELMRDSALKRAILFPSTMRALSVGNELMRDSALKPVRLTSLRCCEPIPVGNELMRDSALKRQKRILVVAEDPQLEMSSCATAL